jgi:ADP-dependent phosphofructokinase/glucokinase
MGMKMRHYLEAACEQIDAAIFSGDDMLDADARRQFNYYLQRWTRQMAVEEDEANQRDVMQEAAAEEPKE